VEIELVTDSSMREGVLSIWEVVSHERVKVDAGIDVAAAVCGWLDARAGFESRLIARGIIHAEEETEEVNVVNKMQEKVEKGGGVLQCVRKQM
jgi:hypothetical protein